MEQKYEIENDFAERKEKAKEHIKKRIKSSKSDIILGTTLFIPSIYFIFLSWFNIWTVLLSLLLIFCIWAIASGTTNNIKYKKYLKIIDDDVSLLEEVEKEIERLKYINMSSEDKIQYKSNNDNHENVLEEKYSVILTAAYGNCIIEVTKYFKEQFSLSL